MSVRSLRYNSLMLGQAKYRSASTDRDAAAFLEAAGIYKSDQRKAIYELVRLLKQYGLWSKMKAIYPFIGGTATTHKWNLKDPRDLDAAFRLTFSGGVTHNADGFTGNGTNGYADTYLTPSVNYSSQINDMALSVYCRTQTGNNSVDIGAVKVSPFSSWELDIIFSSTLYAGLVRNALPYWLTKANTDARGLWIVSRTASNSFTVYKNENVFETSADSANQLPDNKVFIGARGDRTAAFYSNRNYAFVSMSSGLTSTEAANLYSAVDKYQRLLSRNV